ncbi:EamA family transporter [Thalassotalea sp. M1531]|uniref:EamA family transporter n=1 Tax=Thalassotalea algicola TaxID=2716224 RepID=A0A7Y0LCD3_9GAMM|nr:EamA family transporter [Thalassotalea algicola]NMP31081.1 EamA family transporter [Thalassotalea algicola]
MSLKDTLLALIIVSIWGFNFIIIAWGVEQMPPLMMGAGRFIFVALIGCCFIKKPNIPWHLMALYAGTLCFGQFALLFSAIAFGMPAGLASLVLQSQALFTIIFSALVLKEAIKAPQLVAMIVAGIGLAIIGSSEQATHMTALGFSLTIASAVSWGFGNVVNRMINQRGYRADIGLVVWSSWFAIIPFALTSYFVEGSEAIVSAIANFNWIGISVLLYLAIAASMLGYSLWSYLLAHYPAGQVAPLTLAVPVVGLLCAMFFLDEQISSGQFFGIVVVMLGLVINVKGQWLFRKFDGMIRSKLVKGVK